MTAKTREMQRDLFQALLIQNAVPMVFSYLPVVTMFLVPMMTNLYLGPFGSVLFSITAIFPSIDAFFVLFFIGRFRIAVMRLLRFPLCTRFISSGQWTTSPSDRHP
ncbi:hypothetical protein PRIPAC_78004 [Pristionchus pacificus]|uniref:G protein-coupled receptor n=1 Tax=Pristionchus pacificus TaxID=54126 RepID=A0A2A6CPM4_PRIPA|nr:hypothetical protein PRIPAC_78004 [Pristionchus pacificus]|eukprot:PDM80017.1 G protein-coupled receptor [Pristionchus pacificus]